MSDVSKHYDNKFYYPDDLSDMELLQKPTYFESEGKKSKLLTDVEVHMNVLQRFLNECCEKRTIMEIPKAELDSLLCNF